MDNKCVMCDETVPEGNQVCPNCMKTPPSPLPLYAVKHRVSGRFVTGTNFNYYPPRQILSDYHSPLLLTGYNLLSEIKRRNINPKYHTVVRVTVEEEK